MKRRRINENKRVLKAAKRVLVGGVNSPARAFNYVKTDPIPIKKGKGSRIYDYNGNRYIDYLLGFGSVILGHGIHEVTKEISDSCEDGIVFGATNLYEVKLAESIRKAVPFFEKIRFTTSGTEAVMSALRLARGATGRNKIIKFAHSYHGHADHLLAKSGSGVATLGIPGSKGVPKDFTRHTLTAPYGDRRYMDRLFNKFGSDIAAVIVEPVGGNYGVITPDIGFMRYLRDITKKRGSLLLFDEVITGFRLHFGTAAQYFGIKPDLICLGKIIGGGLPIGAYGGGNKVMKHLAPTGGVYQASTFAGNPVVMRAGVKTIHLLSNMRKRYEFINNLTEDLVIELLREAAILGIGLSMRVFCSMFSLRFERKAHFEIFYKIMLKEGIYLAPSEFESNFLSFSHNRKDIEKTINAAKKAFGIIAAKGGLK